MDIIAQVMGNAEPLKLKVATRMLQAMSSKNAAPADVSQFQLADSETETKKVMSAPPGDAGKKARQEAMRGLETVLATKMVEAMMPKDQSRLYGEGTAGEIWRGLHIDAMGKALASRGLFSTSREPLAAVVQRPPNASGTKLIVPFAG
jgi:peptidoglycan hydrolase FlgJ